TPDVIARRIRNVDFASRIGRFLVAGLEGPRRTRVGAMTLLIDLIDSLDHTRLGTLVKDGIDVRMRRIDFAPMLGQTLAAAIAEDRHIPLMNGFINWAAKTLDANEDLVRAMVHERAGTVLRWTGLDENLATAILEGLRKLLDEMATDPQHPMFRKAEEGLARLANDLRTDERLAVRVTHYRDILIDNPAMRFWLEGLWSQARQNLVAILASPDRISSGAIGAAARALGSAMQDNARVRLIMNRFARRTLIGLGVRYGEDVMTLVSETVRGWDAGTVTRRLEGVVGRDLQYIRLNGTLVGGLVGVLIHAIDAAL
ncbi:MAG: DUF445 domain-containing protein, partial [Alphaproteobacteria bacterium]|nr:DUF445 domain-containing protein [Alphaproteobacteria bacterium]